MEPKDSFFDTGEVRLDYIEGPQAGPPLVLLHGATGNHGSWSALFPDLAEHWHIFALDLRGHGQSGWAAGAQAGPQGYHILRFVHDITAFLHKRVESPAVLVGHSWGGVGASACQRNLKRSASPERSAYE
jgi:pimeloyl-ACP methyl ester carboxylesterase